MKLTVHFNQNRVGSMGHVRGGGGGGGGWAHTPFLANYYKNTLYWPEYTNKNLRGGESPTSPTNLDLLLTYLKIICYRF